MDNVGIVVESLDAAVSFFAELGLELEGRAMIEGDWYRGHYFAAFVLDSDG
jgi:catechol 2,3-dioxygenase-like lactoylglutathione lyase family enzyme